MSIDKPSIAELQREITRWPADWEPELGPEGEWLGSWSCSTHNGEPDRVSADVDEDYANNFARSVAQAHNAVPVLLEIAAAALAYEQAKELKRHAVCELKRHAVCDASADTKHGQRAIERHNDEIRCREAYRATLAKVRP